MSKLFYLGLFIFAVGCTPGSDKSSLKPASSVADGPSGVNDEPDITIVEITENDADLPDDITPELLDQAIISYGRCVGESYDVFLRYRADRFTGLTSEVEPSEGGSVDIDAMDRTMQRCNDEASLDQIAGTYQERVSITGDQSRTIAAEFVACMESEADVIVPENDVADMDDVFNYYNQRAATQESSPELIECYEQSVFGPMQEF